jgi:7,8-dihydropterin-6-yl-methyl-4-(beta-D-ribofuranosyl)aminobenzene 5'-phosphate synthase
MPSKAYFPVNFLANEPGICYFGVFSRRQPIMKRCSLFIMMCFLLSGMHGAGQIAVPSVTITYLYDNTTASAGTKSDWGFSCLVQGSGHTLLFDTGADPGILRANMAALHVDASRIQAVVFSHEHSDHTGGVAALGERKGMPAYFPASFGEAARAAFARLGLRLVPVTKTTEVFPGFFTSEEFGTQIREEALIVETPSGLVVVVGCAHPGIIPMLRQITASRKRPIYMALGGFHLLETPAEEVKRIVGEFKALGVSYVGPTHCTGDGAIQLFRAAYGANFIPGGVGTVIRAPVAAARGARDHARPARKNTWP